MNHRMTRLDFAEDNLVPEPVLNVAAFETRLLGVDGHFEHAGLDTTSLASTVVDLVEDAIEEAGYGRKDGGSKFLKILGKLQHITTEKADSSSGMEESDLYGFQNDIRQAKILLQARHSASPARNARTCGPGGDKKCGRHSCRV